VREGLLETLLCHEEYDSEPPEPEPEPELESVPESDPESDPEPEPESEPEPELELGESDLRECRDLWEWRVTRDRAAGLWWLPEWRERRVVKTWASLLDLRSPRAICAFSSRK
jgi:hypothetical protein